MSPQQVVQETIEEEFTSPVILGDQNMIHNSTFNEGVTVGNYGSINNCHIHGSVHLSDHAIITGCVISGNNDQYGIQIDAAPQNQIQINVGNWPPDSISDINNGRAELQTLGYMNADFTLTGPSSIIRQLDAVIPNTDVSYRQFLLNNGLVASIYEMEDTDQEVVTLSAPYGGDHNHINNIRTTARTPRFTDEVIEKAWKLLEDYMDSNQYFAFMEKSAIELENTKNTFRLLIDKAGAFTILEGERGAGIVASSGKIRSYDYPLGDEIAVFIDWFKYKTKELIAQWNCGTYGIVKEGQRR